MVVQPRLEYNTYIIYYKKNKYFKDSIQEIKIRFKKKMFLRLQELAPLLINGACMKSSVAITKMFSLVASLVWYLIS